MSQSAAGDFVKSLKEDISRKKDKIQSKRNLLQDSLNFILNCLSERGETEIRSIRNFEINEIATYFDVYVPEDLFDTFSKILESNQIPYIKSKLQDYKCVFIVDLEDRIITSGNSHNLFSLEVCSKRLKTYKVKISPCEKDVCYSIFDKGYHEIKFWYKAEDQILLHTINLRGIDRKKNKVKIKDLSTDLEGILIFNDTGQIETFDLFPKRRKKIEESSYNTLNINSNE